MENGESSSKVNYERELECQEREIGRWVLGKIY